ncbi:GNAT family N-acetyltransferase [Bdellovibrio svalbardensis]|uniref:GNAT family N-acetyltransferase n=1 Tax=Bdellovibrio svalbardensis TaxID=2972972 RepID=A0ABT6DJX8_9BACT|nr:GNAT family N-acetyltransferase [Bdellovibrio svalbardensis]MDG0817180.1 GNAT family N-acetyltransferase [Bdellovibrio svalbardensis]
MTSKYEIRLNSKIDIRRIYTNETLPLRKKVLKPFLTEEECINPGDDLTSTYHFGLFQENKLISISTFIQEGHPDFLSTFPYRLRGMATDTEFQGQGLGGILLQHGVEYLRQKECDFLWFNARIKAFPFYEKLGFSYYGPLFDIKDIGPHKVMYKILIPK